MKKAEYLGLDILELKPGDVITSEQLHRLYTDNTNKTNDVPFWSFCLRLKVDIENTLFWAGHPVAVRQKRMDMHIIQHAEMSEYCYNLAEKYLAQVVRKTALMKLVDVGPMTDEERKVHARRAFIMDEVLSSLIEKRNRLGLSSGEIMALAQLKEGNVPLPDMDE